MSKLLYADSDGSVPLWEAMFNRHNSVMKLLSENGAQLTSGDVSLFSCTAAEQSDLDLLKEIVRHGGDVTRPMKNGRSPLHIAVCEGNTEIVKFLLDQGANIETTDESGWTARDLAEQQGHEDIKELFESYEAHKTDIAVTIPEERPGVRFLGRLKSEPAPKNNPTVTTPEERHGVRFLGRFKSEPSILPDSFPPPDGSWGRFRPRRRINNFSNSLFGIMSAAQTGENNFLTSVEKATIPAPVRTYAARVTVTCPEKGDFGGKLVLVPRTFEELLEIGAKKYGFFATKVLSENGAEIDDIELIRDGDRLVFASDNRIDETSNQQ